MLKTKWYVKLAEGNLWIMFLVLGLNYYCVRRHSWIAFPKVYCLNHEVHDSFNQSTHCMLHRTGNSSLWKTYSLLPLSILGTPVGNKSIFNPTLFDIIFFGFDFFSNTKNILWKFQRIGFGEFCNGSID